MGDSRGRSTGGSKDLPLMFMLIKLPAEAVPLPTGLQINQLNLTEASN